ncbi:carbamoyl phosphate synthase small subunit [Serpentinicella sp. ANB-PHB4]|uniref:carbamoyl phosphate synthase small subunit n=1 Tax=Serpentinicella sp. ANB-PHB4 TaxID=3074076 RepID=UPI002855ACD5|nr:carbamoyl phosphate synthase small subunit [Serpentinicella sp. ANB-PHB4]MDR5659320.1 carbamoyl phosphate synthase small subunit [Serpentinicella sp. ANB-PHB4]
MKAALILEDGTRFLGESFGYYEEIVGEVVFNTSMTGYQEVFTDPSYYGQIVNMTYPMIGNYGINTEEMESTKPQLNALIVREAAKNPSNWRCEMNIEGYLKLNKVVGLEGIDTRALTKLIRNAGTMKGIITTDVEMSQEVLEKKLSTFNNKPGVMDVSTNKTVEIEGEGPHVAIIDLGLNKNLLKSFTKENCRVTIFSADTTAEDILNVNPDGIFLSNGPGNPKDIPEVLENIKRLIGVKPMMGVCLGYQLLALALGGNTLKMKYGHRGGNHPVKDLSTNKVYITSQNHGYVVEESSLPEEVKVSHRNMNDGTMEGLVYEKQQILGVQFRPELSSGSHSTAYILDKFIDKL